MCPAREAGRGDLGRADDLEPQCATLAMELGHESPHRRRQATRARGVFESVGPPLERSHRGLRRPHPPRQAEEIAPAPRGGNVRPEGLFEKVEEAPGEVGGAAPAVRRERLQAGADAVGNRSASGHGTRGSHRGSGFELAAIPPGGSCMPIRPPLASKSPRVFPKPLKGRVERHRHTSQVLKGNPWGDPVERELPVYLPPSGATEGKPLLVLLTGYTGAGWIHFQAPRFLADNHVGRLDRLIASGRAAEAVLIAPDGMTSLGGSQYLNSSATGRYDDYVTREIIPWARARYSTGPVGVLGTSSGGFGALSLAMRHPDVFQAAASDSGDMYFEYGYLPEVPLAWRAIRKAGGPEALLKKLFSGPVDGFGPSSPLARGLEFMAYASCYSPNDSRPGSFELPFDLQSGAIREDVWRRWLAFDPVRMAQTPRYLRALRQLKYVYVDGGRADEWNLEVAARIFATVARAGGVSVDFEEFSGGHFDVARRYETMFPRILEALGFPPKHARSGPRRDRPTRPRSRPQTRRARRNTS